MRIILVSYIYPSRLEVSVSAQSGFATVQASFATVSDLGQCPRLGLVLVLAVAVGRRKHNFTQFNRIKIHNINDFFRYQTYTTTRGHNYKIYKPHAKRFCRVNFFTLRTINNWNSLPASVVESATVNSFKNSLDSFWSYKHYISD